MSQPYWVEVELRLILRMRLKMRLTFDFDLIFGSFWALLGYFWGWGRVQKLWWGVLVELSNFLFYVTFDSYIWFWLNFWVISYFLGPIWAIFGVRERFKKCFGVDSCSWTTFIFYVSFNSDIWFWLDFGVILDFLGPTGVSLYRLITYVFRVLVYFCSIM